jgi:hypothetical protein
MTYKKARASGLFCSNFRNLYGCGTRVAYMCSIMT